MKKTIFLSIVLLVCINLAIASSGIYTNNYVKHLKNCEVYIEKSDVQIPTQDEKMKTLHLKTTETILGWKNGKCLTKSEVYSKDLNKNILNSNCAFSESQLDTVVKKMQTSFNKDNKTKQEIQNNLTKYIKDNSICITKNLAPESN